MNSELIFLAQATSDVLLGWWKVPLILAPFIAWGWLVSTFIEKDARYFHFNWRMWNGIFLGSAGAAAVVMLLIPGWVHIFWVVWPIGVLILAAPVLVYWQYRNKRVPENKRFYLTGEAFSKKLEERRRVRADRDVAIQFADASGHPINAPLKDDPLYEVHIFAEDLIGPAITARASRVELVVNPKGTAITQTIDGVKFKREAMPVESALRLIDFLKGIAGLEVEDRRRQQAGDFNIKGRDLQANVHLVTAGSSQSQALRIEFNRAERLSKPFDGLGLLAAQVEALQPLVEPQNRHGIVLIGAPQGQGLSTSMYSFLNRHDAYTSNIKSLERDIQLHLDGVDQIRFDPTNPDIDYATNLQSILRRDPDVVMTSELDAESARVATEPGMEGPLIYVPQRAGSIPEQINAWIKLVSEPKRAIKPLRAVVNQRLLRTVCPHCRQAYTPKPAELRKFGIPEGKVTTLYQKSGKVQVKNRIEQCPVCNGIGYMGQTAAFEVMVVDDEMRPLLMSGDIKAALDHARRNKMIYLAQAALSKVVAGETTIEELLRVTGQRRSPGSKQAAAKSSAQDQAAVAQ